MKRTMLLLAAIILMSACQTKNSDNQINNQDKAKMESIEKQKIENLLFTYRDALNASDVSKVLPLYTEDGIFMPSGAPTSIGTEQVKGAYEFVFSNIQLSIEFYIDEIIVNGEYAFARTTSKGSTLIRATGETVPEENRELFVLQKENGSWKIDRYMFNKMK
ncbi:MAG: SgcJ/EcaC family oxidoreductase [Bacteroidetes bacterium]|nr:SgcJ/EcaC family oxidoreductase [Bacteroidota bacterium]